MNGMPAKMDMNSEYYRVRLHTKGKSLDSEESRKFFDTLDGAEVAARKANKNDWCGEGYVLSGWYSEFDDQIKEAIWIAEQGPDGTYAGERERFDKDWSNEEYEGQGAIVFEMKDVEELENITKKG